MGSRGFYGEGNLVNLNLSNQEIEKIDIQPKSDRLNSLLEQRKEVWGKCSIEIKKKWIDSKKDPIINLAYNLYKYLKTFFQDIEDDLD